MRRLWDKGGDLHERIHAFTVGDDPSLDARLVKYDSVASQAHARMLAAQGYLSADEAELLCRALGEIAESHERNEWLISVQEEDCHTALENRLTEKLGELGGKIHLGRSRNDQVLTALRLYLRDACHGIRSATKALSQSLESLAARYAGVPLPGYTHMQRAMPSSVELWAHGFSEEVKRSAETFSAAEVLLDLNPLGSAAGYGTPGLQLDRDMTTRELGFAEPQEPVTSVQLSRGKAEAAVAFSICLILQDVGRLASDMCLFATQEFGFVRLDGSITTGSSVMPQKRNPDVYELLRAHASVSASDLLAILALTEKLPSGYHRDLQLIKVPLFRAIDRAQECLKIAAQAIVLTQFDASATSGAMDESLFAAERAFKLVQETGLSFREAYQRVASEIKI